MSDQSIKLGLALGLTTMGRWRGEQEQWEVLFEGTVETVEISNGYATNESPLGLSFAVGETIRLTVNGASATFVAVEQNGIARDPCIGNQHLNGNAIITEDTGYDFCLTIKYLYTRSPGTYAVKVERVVN